MPTTLHAVVTNDDGSQTVLDGTVTLTTVPAPLPPPPPPVTYPIIPENATKTQLVSLADWPCNHDAGTPGTATGTSTYPVTALSAPNLRELKIQYTGKGGEIYHPTIGEDTNQTDKNFLYELLVAAPDWSQVENLEMDINHVDAEGDVTIIGTQMAGGSGTFEYTEVVDGKTHWVPSKIVCDPSKLSPNEWHHIFIASEIDGDGNVLYKYVVIDGVVQGFAGQTASAILAFSRENLNWGKNVETAQLQIDGKLDAGDITLYVQELNVYHW